MSGGCQAPPALTSLLAGLSPEPSRVQGPRQAGASGGRPAAPTWSLPSPPPSRARTWQVVSRSVHAFLLGRPS